MVRFLVLIAVAFVMGIAAVWVVYRRVDRPIVLPKPRGPHAVGRSVLDLIDTRRNREMMLFLWYPAADGSRGARAEYVPGKWGELWAKGLFPIPSRRLREIEVASVVNVPMTPAVHPLLMLSPAMGRIPADYTTIAEDLASYGYIVAGVTPTGGARVVVFNNGRTVYGDDNIDLERRAETQPMVQRWLEDVQFVLDQLLSGTFLVDSNRIGIFGHSFGGAVATHAVAVDARFRRGVNLDGAPQGILPQPLDRPFLFVNGAPLPPSQQALNDRILGEIQGICKADRAGCRIEDYPEAGHMNFSDLAVMPSRFPIPRSRMSLTNIDGVPFLRTTSDLLRRFFDAM
ncbi:MAG TPA: prolyl oligopeptidase family serine peptidase [Bryobacteraceae bacterium]|nr:prolyl oligopeptidase family serine peptidase [Bryobacteraceae bacterium]